MPAKSLSEPWRSFLVDLDSQLEGATELHCLGGFIVAEYFGYATELRFQSTIVRRDDLTLSLWIEMIKEIQRS
jgi:hypothetical protein